MTTDPKERPVPKADELGPWREGVIRRLDALEQVTSAHGSTIANLITRMQAVEATAEAAITQAGLAKAAADQAAVDVVTLGVKVADLEARLATVESQAHGHGAEPRRVVYAHSNNPVTDTWSRMVAGWATGAAIYGSDSNVFGIEDVRPILDTYPGIHLDIMCKSFTAESLQTIVDGTTADERARMRVTNGQEPEDDDNKQSDEARAAFRARTQLLISVLRPAGIRCGVHLQTWTTNPNWNPPAEHPEHRWGGPVNGPLTIAAFMPQGDDEPLDFVGASLYDYHRKKTARLNLEPFIAACRAAQPGVEIHVTAAGWGVDYPVKAGQAELRADCVRDALAVIDEMLPGSDFGWFDLKWGDVGKDYRTEVDPLLTDVLVSHFAGEVLA